MEIAEYKRFYGDRDDAAPGWEAINTRLRDVYQDQEPKHWGTLVPYALGGADPLDGISAYECREGGINHLHFCTYGFSSLYYDEESLGSEWSGNGFELTFRFASPLPPLEEPLWVCNLLQNLARYVFQSGRGFEAFHWIPTNSPLRAASSTDLIGLAFVLDPILNSIETPHGRVEFIQAFGINAEEIALLKSRTLTCEQLLEQHRHSNPLLITDLQRKHL